MKRSERTWSELAFPARPDASDVQALVEHLAASSTLGTIVFEARASGGHVRYLLGSDPDHHSALTRLIFHHLPGYDLVPLGQSRDAPDAALTVRASGRGLPLRTDSLEATTLSMLSALSAATSAEEVILQLTLGRRLAPALDDDSTPRYLTLRDALIGQADKLPTSARTRYRAKRAVHGFEAAIRLGARAGNERRTHGLLRALLGGLRTLEAPGVRLGAHDIAPGQITDPAVSNGLLSRPLALSSIEVAALLSWPVGKGFLPGQPPKHPKRVNAPTGLRDARRPFAVATQPGHELRVGLGREDSLTHALLIGRTGSGKSVVMSHLILDAIDDGRSVLVIDPKGDLISREILPRIPAIRRDDVVVIDPMSDLPVGINPFAEPGSAELIADGLLAVFKTVYADSWGPRLEDILSSALLTLARTKGSTLAMLPALLTDAAVRRRLTKSLHDPVGLEPFWHSYEAMSPEQRAQVIAPVLNKLRPYLLRSSLRRTLGQADPKFSLSELFSKRRIVLVNLNKGLLGAEGARLLGSLVVSQVWPLILNRAAVPPERRHIVNVFIDEVQDYLALPTDLADAFAQARGLGVGFTVAHQYRRQLPGALLAGLDSNARSVIAFGLDHDDAVAVAKRAPNLEAEDFMSLGRHEVYANLMNGGEATGWFMASTLGPTAPLADAQALLRISLERYGRAAADVDREIERAIGIGEDIIAPDEPIGRRPKGGSS
ncbi:MAG TPA: DUF87 domain-containing protein [Galbitalea sp.]|jgi:hypothetical protein|nr:DUF87 domain-containing protein [Galbitalea sp.]